MKYAKYHCSGAKFILKTNDDVYVKMGDLLEELSPFKAEGLLLGFVFPPEVRNEKDKCFMGVSLKSYCRQFLFVAVPVVCGTTYGLW